ncbi:MAG TPA: hypothetical protein VM187_19125, partial [Niastella sp.]|nr:hypothetical protein [Niastella sp.]
MSTVKKYLSLIKFSHTIFAMPFALIGFMLAAAGIIKSLFGAWYGQYPNESFAYADGSPFNFNTLIGRLVLKFVLVILCM